MVISLKKILSTNAPLKFFSFLLGYGMWFVLSSNNIITLETNVPLCFYNIANGYHINAPDKVSVTLAGTRKQIYALNLQELAIHLDAHTVYNNNYPIVITKDTLFLPDSIKLVHYSPAPLKVEIIKEK